MTETNFYFGRLTFGQLARLGDFSTFGATGRSDLIRTRLQEYIEESSIIYRESDGYWRFGRATEHDGRLFGKLGKIFTEERTRWNDQIGDYETVEEEVEVADVSFFLIDPEIEGIAFNRKLHTGSTKFAQAFCTGYSHYYDLNDEMGLDLIRTGGDMHYSEVLEKARKVFSVEFRLEPVNPSASEEMKILDDHIKAMNADEVVLESESEEGLNPQEEFLRSGFVLSDDGGYGDYTIRYEAEGEQQMYDSRGNHATETTIDPDNLDELIDISGYLVDRLHSLIEEWETG